MIGFQHGPPALIREVVADLRAVLPRTVGVYAGTGWLYVAIDGERMRLTMTDGEVLLRRLPPVACEDSEHMIRGMLPHPIKRIRRALWRLRRRSTVPRRAA